MKFNEFYDYQHLTDFLFSMVESAPDMLSLFPIADTPEGKCVWCVELGDKAGRPFEERHGFLALGNMHAVELAGSNVCMYLLKYLIDNRRSDPRVEEVLKERVIYIIPRVAVDGADYILRTYNRVRSKPTKIKERNVPYPEDIDGDGKILTMRWKSEDGNYKLSELDPRLTIPREPSDVDGPFYNMCVEGFIHEWDGGKVGTSRSICDFNRNFPANWQPVHIARGQKKYPLSEPETRGLADFVLSHPNIVASADFHTGNPAIFLPNATVEKIARHAQDARSFKEIGQLAQDITGFPLLSGYDEVRTGEPSKGLPGSFKEWCYEHLGLHSFVIELGLFYNYLGVTTHQAGSYPSASQREEELGSILLKWHDGNPEEELFFQWRAYEHPQLGQVELGGWNWILWSNPPPMELEGVSSRCTDFVMEYLSYAPSVKIEDTNVEKLSEDIFKVSACVINRGKVSTSITRQGMDTSPDSNPRVIMESPDEIEFIIGKEYQEIEHLGALRDQKKLEWVIKISPSSHVTLKVQSDKGVYAAKTLPLEES